jgi:hypothetical protein
MFNFFRKAENNDWKEKAKQRREENKALKKQLKEVLESRNNWKKKAQDLKKKNEMIDEELKKNH